MAEPVTRALWGALYEIGLDAHQARIEAERLDRELGASHTAEAVHAVLTAHVERCRASHDEAIKKRVILAYERGAIVEVKRAALQAAAAMAKSEAGIPSAEMP